MSRNPYAHLESGENTQDSQLPHSPGRTGDGPYSSLITGSARSSSEALSYEKHHDGMSSSEHSEPFKAAFTGGSDGVRSRKGGFSDPFADYNTEETDDWLHNANEKDVSSKDFSWRGFMNIGTLFILAAGLLLLFLGYPIIIVFKRDQEEVTSVRELSQKTAFPQKHKRGLVDPDTPTSAYNRTSIVDDKSWHLVFSDEFNEEGRTFWPGDDPYWEAFNGWYSGTMDYEWYSPEAINTTNGHLQIAFEEQPIEGLNFRSGMLQSWNKVCFQGGYLEISAILPGMHNVAGYWPGLWTMGNLGRPGYSATNEGMWPYSYNACDTGAMPNQTYANKTGPEKAINANGQFSYQVNNKLSWLPGMRLPACVCEGEEHPGPNRNVGRSAPEIDMLEAKIGTRGGQSSQSLQIAPFDVDYYYGNSTTNGDLIIHDTKTTEINDYHGNELQQAVSALADVPAYAYEQETDHRFVNFALEWEPDWNGDGEGAYITWYIDGKPNWTLYSQAIGPVPELDVSRRLIPREPMSVIMNVAMAYNFQPPNWDELVYPGIMKIDYVRMYQIDGRPDKVSCDPPDYPTKSYIKRHADIYDDNRIQRFPKDRIPKNEMTGC